MVTVPNQHIIKIHRDKPQSNFLQIKNENWQNMLKDTNDYYAFVLYLYLAANANDYSLALSPAAITEATGLAKSTYYRKLSLLKEKGYIIEDKGNLLHFYEVPQKKKDDCGSLPCGQKILPEKHENLGERQGSLPQEQNHSADNIEIDNRYDIDNINMQKILNILADEETQDQKPKEFIF